MEGIRDIDPADISAGIEDIPTENAAKRPKKPSLKMLSQEDSSKVQKMVLNDDLLIFLGEVIQGDPDAWGIMLDKAKRGKSSVQLKLISYLSKHSNPLTHGRTSTTETVSKWIGAGLELADKEAGRRADGGVAGRQMPNDQIPKPQRVWYELVQYFAEWQRAQPTTSRYTTPPAHLKGKVELKFDDSPALPNGREEKTAGVELREQAVAKVAADRDAKRKDSPDSKEHLHPKRGKQEPVAESGSDAFMQMYVACEVDRNKIEAQRAKQEILTAKTEQLNKFVQMLANPNLPEESKAVIARLPNNAANELTALSTADSAGGAGGAVAGGGAAGGGASPFTTPEKPTPDALPRIPATPLKTPSPRAGADLL